MPIPTQSDVHINQPLTMLTEAFLQKAKDFVSMNVFPPIPVLHKSDVFYKYDRSDFFRDEMKAYAPGTEAESAGYNLETGNYNATEYKLAHPIPDSILRNADSMLNLEQAGTNFLTLKAMINREVRWASKYFVPNVWDTTIAGNAAPGVGQVKFWNLGGSTPIEDILQAKATIKQSTSYDANVLVLGYQVKQQLKTNAEIIDRLKYGQTAPGAVTVKDSDLAQLFEVDRVVEMGAIKTTSKEGVSPATFDFIGGKNALLAYAAPAPGLMVASAGYTFNWQGYPGSVPGGTGWRIKDYRWERISSRILEIEQSYDFGLVATALGYLFSGIVQ